VLVAQRLLQGNGRYLGQERQLLGALPLGQRGVGLLVACRLAVNVVAPVAFGKGLVPHKPYAPERAVEHRGLFGIRVSPAPVRVRTKISLHKEA
jgi:hypothetical protein